MLKLSEASGKHSSPFHPPYSSDRTVASQARMSRKDEKRAKDFQLRSLDDANLFAIALDQSTTFPDKLDLFSSRQNLNIVQRILRQSDEVGIIPFAKLA